MAPELYASSVTTSLANSDIFALGIILVNFLTGEYPFDSVFDGDQVSKEYLDFYEHPDKFLHTDD